MLAPLVALTTDFGWGSAYVAQLKGVLLSRLRDVRIVDVAHDLPAHDILAAELLLRGVAFAFPVGTVHLVVVDPGVGTDRRAIAVASRGMFFVGPDNGVLGVALAQEGATCVELDRPGLRRQPVAPTFHGRDIFAPVAAELAAGAALADIGSALAQPLPSTVPAPTCEAGVVRGEVLGADRFGNLLTNLDAGAVERALGAYDTIMEGVPLARCRTYGEAEADTLVAVTGSDGYLEIAVRQGSAAAALGRDRGTPVECRGRRA